MLVYITKNNFSKIVRKIPVNGLKLDGDLYVRFNKNLNAIFSKFERTELLLYKMLCENPEKFLEEVYAKADKREDTYTWVYEEQKSPCYHGDPNCPRLNSDFENYQVPLPIKYKGIESDIPLDRLRISDLSENEQNIVINNVKIYRNWWATEGEYLYKSDVDTFLMRVIMRFHPNPRITDIKEFKQKNSGIEEFDNCTLQEIEERIDSLIIAARDYFYENEKHTSILRAYAKLTYYVLVKNEIPASRACNYSNEDITSVLEEFNDRFKKPLENLLRNYFQIKNNPELKMDSTILDELGFVPCGNCYHHLNFSIGELEPLVKECDIKDEYEKFLNLFLEKDVLSFAKTYISMYYPFTYQEILDRWEYIIHGDAHYSFYMTDIESTISPKLGLSFNHNIRWNSKLRAKYEYGVIDPFNGYVDGTHRGGVEFDERDYLDDILPLDIVNEMERKNSIVIDWLLNNYNESYLDELDRYDLELVKKVYSCISFRDFKELINKSPYVILGNKSIWHSTLINIVDLEFCDKVLGCHKPQDCYVDEVLPY